MMKKYSRHFALGVHAWFNEHFSGRCLGLCAWAASTESWPYFLWFHFVRLAGIKERFLGPNHKLGIASVSCPSYISQTFAGGTNSTYKLHPSRFSVKLRTIFTYSSVTLSNILKSYKYMTSLNDCEKNRANNRIMCSVGVQFRMPTTKAALR